MIVVVPMAGRGSRFAGVEPDRPKPLIPVRGEPMVAWALRSLAAVPRRQTIFVALREHERRFGVTALLRRLVDDAQVILLDDVTAGQACTVLAARAAIDRDEDLLIASADTYIESSIGEDIARRAADCRGLISVADLPGDRWSFARADAAGRVVEVAEKRRISDHASTGLYHFASGAEFVAAADELIARRETTRGEYYVIPVYGRLIARGARIELSRARAMWDMGTPEALAAFERHLDDR